MSDQQPQPGGGRSSITDDMVALVKKSLLGLAEDAPQEVTPEMLWRARRQVDRLTDQLAMACDPENDNAPRVGKLRAQVRRRNAELARLRVLRLFSIADIDILRKAGLPSEEIPVDALESLIEMGGEVEDVDIIVQAFAATLAEREPVEGDPTWADGFVPMPWSMAIERLRKALLSAKRDQVAIRALLDEDFPEDEADEITVACRAQLAESQDATNGDLDELKAGMRLCIGAQRELDQRYADEIAQIERDIAGDETQIAGHIADLERELEEAKSNRDRCRDDERTAIDALIGRLPERFRQLFTGGDKTSGTE